MQNEDRQEISDTLKLLIHNNTKCQDMSGKKIYGNIQKVEKKNITGMTYQLSNETGHGEITVYRVFTGIELYYNDMHMEYCNQNQATVKNMIEINHCLIGRFECSFGENSCCYMAEGDLSISSMMKKKSNLSERGGAWLCQVGRCSFHLQALPGQAVHPESHFNPELPHGIGLL